MFIASDRLIGAWHLEVNMSERPEGWLIDSIGLKEEGEMLSVHSQQYLLCVPSFLLAGGRQDNSKVG